QLHCKFTRRCVWPDGLHLRALNLKDVRYFHDWRVLWKDFFQSGHAADLCFSEGRNEKTKAQQRTQHTRRVVRRGQSRRAGRGSGGRCCSALSPLTDYLPTPLLNRQSAAHGGELLIGEGHFAGAFARMAINRGLVRAAMARASALQSS